MRPPRPRNPKSKGSIPKTAIGMDDDPPSDNLLGKANVMPEPTKISEVGSKHNPSGRVFINF
jgi:hypothetical protein